MSKRKLTWLEKGAIVYLIIVIGLIAFAVFNSGCGLIPEIKSKDMPAVIQALGRDQASACVWLGGRGGAGGGAIVPVPVVPAVGYGSGEILVGRVNAPNTKLTIDNGKCIIERK